MSPLDVMQYARRLELEGGFRQTSRQRTLSDGNVLGMGGTGEERDRCSALGAVRQPSRNGTSVPLKVTADFAVALAANSSTSAVRAR
jgi:hypothetical protein